MTLTLYFTHSVIPPLHPQFFHIYDKQKEGLVTLSAPEKDTAYTMITSDPDAPTRANATLREFIHHGLLGRTPHQSPVLILCVYAL